MKRCFVKNQVVGKWYVLQHIYYNSLYISVLYFCIYAKKWMF